MTIRFTNIDDMLDTLCPQNMGMYVIGFTSDKTGGDFACPDTSLDSDDNLTRLAAMLDLPEQSDKQSDRMRSAIWSGNGFTDEERVAWTAVEQIQEGDVESAARLCLEAGVHMYVKPGIIQLDAAVNKED